MFFVYVLYSETHESRYVGSTEDVARRLKQHNAGECRYTSGRKPWRIVYTEQFQSRSEAMKREKSLKSGQGRKELDQVLKKEQHSGIV